MAQIINSEDNPKKLMNEIVANEVTRMSQMHIQYISFKAFASKLIELPDK